MGRFIAMLKLSAFAVLVFSVVLATDLSQAIGESFLVPQENQAHALVNQARTANGLSSLPNDDALRWMARRQARAMSAAGYIFHNPNLAGEADASGVAWTTIGENVGKGPTVPLVHSAFMSSPTHRANILKPEYNALGIGGVGDPEALIYLAQVFAGIEAPAAPASPPAPAVDVVAPSGRDGPTDPAQPSATRAPTAAPTEAPTPDPTIAPDPTATPDPTPDGDDGLASGVRRASVSDGQEGGVQDVTFWEVMLTLLTRFADRVTFWS